MAVRRLDIAQPETFEFTPENLAWAEERIATFPNGKQASAVIQLLWRAQEQHGGWLPEPAIRHVAEMLEMPYIRVYEVATFYTMFQLKPVGRVAHVQVCGTTPCALRGAGDLLAVCKKRISPEPFTVSEDGKFSWEEVECLGACSNGPMLQIWGDNYEDLTGDQLDEILNSFERGEVPVPGPQNGRVACAPLGGPTSLTQVPAYQSTTIPNLPGATSAEDGTVVAPEAAPVETKQAKEAEAPGKPDTKIETVDEIKSPDQNVVAARDESGLLTKRDLEDEAEDVAAKLRALPSDASTEEKANAVGARPTGLDAPREGKADDLTRVKGIGKINEDRLNDLGVYHFDQIASWGRPEVRWVTTYLAFPGRIDREDWLGQAAELAQQEEGSD